MSFENILSRSVVTAPEYRDARYNGFGLTVHLDGAQMNINELLTTERTRLLRAVEQFGVVEISLEHNDESVLKQEQGLSSFRPTFPSFTDAHWHQDGSHQEVPTEKYKIALLWLHEEPRKAGTTDIVPIRAFAQTAQAIRDDRSIPWDQTINPEAFHENIDSAVRILEKEQRKSDYPENALKHIGDAMNNPNIGLYHDTISSAISTQLSAKGLPVHRIEWKSPTLALFSNRNTFHRRNCAKGKPLEYQEHKMMRTEFLEQIHEDEHPASPLSRMWNTICKLLS